MFTMEYDCRNAVRETQGELGHKHDQLLKVQSQIWMKKYLATVQVLLKTIFQEKHL